VDVDDDELLGAADYVFAGYEREEELTFALRSRLPNADMQAAPLRDGKVVEERPDDE
jgi:hypothetical protein